MDSLDFISGSRALVKQISFSIITVDEIKMLLEEGA